MTAFYVDLPSNASMHAYPDNTLARFKVKLARPIRFSCPYEVALVEITYPHKHLTFTPKEAYLVYLEKPHNPTLDTSRFYVAPGIYETINDIRNGVNEFLGTCGLRFDHMHDADRFQLTGANRNNTQKFLKLSGRLAKMLGYGEGISEHVLIALNNRAKYPPDFKTERSHMFVYCNIVEHQVVGDSLARLIRVVNLEPNKNSAVTCEKYLRAYYLPVDRDVVDIIEITIKDITGNAFPFVSGTPVIIKLHFRPKHGTSSSLA